MKKNNTTAMTVNYVFFKMYSLGGSNNFSCKTVPKKTGQDNG